MRVSGLIVAGLAFAIAYVAVVREVRADGAREGRGSLSGWVLYAALPAPVLLFVLEDVSPLQAVVVLWSSVGVLLSALGAALTMSAHRALGDWRASGSQALLTSGPYAVIRHPQAVGFGAALLGLAAASLSGAALLVAALYLPAYLLVIRREEVRLRARFGEAHEQYVSRVGLWGQRRGRPSCRRAQREAQ